MSAEHDIPHGTTTGYQVHKCRCADCRAWKAAYQRERRSNPDVMRRHLEREAARHRALARLALMQPVLYRALYDEEMGR